MKEGWGGSGGREGRAGGGKYIGNELRSAKYHLKHSQQNFRMNFDSLTLPPGSWVCVCLCEVVGGWEKKLFAVNCSVTKGYRYIGTLSLLNILVEKG